MPVMAGGWRGAARRAAICRQIHQVNTPNTDKHARVWTATPPKPSPPARSNANLRLAAACELRGAAPAMEVAGASAGEVAAAAALEAGENRSRMKPGQIRPSESPGKPTPGSTHT
eukprot:jgi/Tetstr1/466464/TSEL_000973.t1